MMSQKYKASKQAEPSSTVDKIFESQELKGKFKLMEETSTISLEEKGHKTKTVRKKKNSSKNKDERSKEQFPITIPQTKKKKRKLVSTSDPLPPCKRTTRRMEKKGKVVVNPHTHEDPIDITSPSEDLSVQDDIPSLIEEQVTITLYGKREEVEEREYTQPETMGPKRTLTKEQMKKKIGELQKQNQELKQ
jgi:hypothetical protein